MSKSYKNILATVLLVIISVYTGLNNTKQTSPKQNKQLTKQEVSKSSKNVLALSWYNYFCKTHTFKKECKNRSKSKYKNQFVLHGLWPQPRNNINCNKTKLQLNIQTLNELKIYMPGVASNLHKHEWSKHGTCYSNNATKYFQDSISLTKEFNSLFAKFFKQKNGQIITKNMIVKLFNKKLFHGAGKKFKLICKNGFIKEIRLNIYGQVTSLKDTLKKAPNIFGGCTKGKLSF